MNKTFYYLAGGVIAGCVIGYFLPDIISHDLPSSENILQVSSEVRNIMMSFGGLVGLVSGSMAKTMNEE